MATHDSHAHHAPHAPHAHGSDKGAAFVGLFGGIVVLAAVMYGIVQWTNAQFAGHTAGAPPAAAGAPAKH
jgi:hypothetical protein